MKYKLKYFWDRVMSYEFNPEDYGYEHVSNFPELEGLFGPTTFVKVIAIGGKTFGRIVYWYSYCYKMGMNDDQRWKIASSSYSEDSPGNFSSHTTYNGVISSKKFAKNLLMHLFGTSKNDSVLTDGKQRLKQNINKERLTLHKL